MPRTKTETGTHERGSLDELLANLQSLGNAEIATHSQRFFKTGPGEYGEGDRFLGIRVPALRKLVKTYRHLPSRLRLKLFQNSWHEARLLALLLLVDAFQRGTEQEQRWIYQQYLAHTDYINNWDLVDSSAHLIVGPWLQARSRKPLFTLARSTSLWERRIAMMATLHYIRQNDFSPTLDLAQLLLRDPEELIHKVSGWMLREVGNRDIATARAFLDQHAASMPRTMLRYAIERFPEPLRQHYLHGKR